MANTATLVDAYPATAGGAGNVLCFKVAIDTPNTALTVVTPGTAIEASDALSGVRTNCGRTTDRWWVVGVDLVDSTASTITWQSGDTVLNTPELATYQGVGDGVNKDKWYYGGFVGNALKIKSSALITSMLIYVVIAERFR